MELELSNYEKARWCKGKGCFAKNAENHNLVLAQHSTYFKFNCSFNCLTELSKDMLGPCFDGIAEVTFFKKALKSAF